MAGREGLVDTAVKTARSGYLQRCLIKHLEGLKVNYDNTVRDTADGSIYQFHYGEDSLDVIKAAYLNDFKFNAQNYAAFLEKYRPRDAAAVIDCEKALKYQRKVVRKPKKYDPVLSKFPPSRHLGAVSEKFSADLQHYIDSNPDGILEAAGAGEDVAESAPARKMPKPNTFEALMHLKYLHSLVEPAEAVGLLAAQSIGEPSTQMTLNTFHFAGHGAKNVTLGIPRLREIIMTASTKLKTPMMTVPARTGTKLRDAEALCRRLSRLTLDMIMTEATVTERLLSKSRSMVNERMRNYTVRLRFCSRATYADEYGLTGDEIQMVLQQRFVKRLVSAINKELKSSRRKDVEELDAIGQGVDVGKFQESSSALASMAGDGDEASRAKSSSRPESDKIKSVVSDDEQDDMEVDATAANRAQRRKQQASYDGPDDDDKEILASMEKNNPYASDDEDAVMPASGKSTPVSGSKPSSPKSSPAEGSDEDDSDADEEATDSVQQVRRDQIVSQNRYVRDYRFDQTAGEWCEFDLQVCMGSSCMPGLCS